MSDELSTKTETQEDIERLLTGIPIVVDPCDLDLLMFFYRHPRALLTSEQVAAFVGYDMKEITKSIDRFIDAGLLDRKQNPMHAARLYLLVLEGPKIGGLKTLLELASTREGRETIFQSLEAARRESANDPRRAHADLDQAQRRLYVA
jgi:predicted transcriptional regulator